MKECLRQIVEKVPFNNVSKFLYKDGKRTLPENLGGNCVELGERLISKLLEQTLADEAQLIDITSNYRHTAVLATKGDAVFFLDPGLLQLSPVQLNTLEEETVEGLPMIGQKPAKLLFKKRQGGSLEITRSYQSEYGAFCFSYPFNLNKTRRTHPKKDWYGVYDDPTHLLFRFQMPDGELRMRQEVDNYTKVEFTHLDPSGTLRGSTFEAVNDSPLKKNVEDMEERYSVGREDLKKSSEMHGSIVGKLPVTNTEARGR